MKKLQEIMFMSAFLFMPDYPTPRPASHNYTRNVAVDFVDHAGHTASLNISGIDPTVTSGEVDTLREKAGALSNAGVIGDRLEDATVMAIVDAISHIDPYAEVSDKGVFRFDHPNNNFKPIYVELPAIWDDVVTDAGLIDTGDTRVGDFVSACLAVLNKVQIGGGNFYLGKAYYSDRKGTRKIASVRPISRDPRGGGS